MIKIYVFQSVCVDASLDVNFSLMSLLVNTPKTVFLSSFALMKMFPMSSKFILSVLSLCTCNVMRWFRRLSFMVLRRYVLTLLSAEKDLSLRALVAGITSKSFTTRITSEASFLYWESNYETCKEKNILKKL